MPTLQQHEFDRSTYRSALRDERPQDTRKDCPATSPDTNQTKEKDGCRDFVAAGNNRGANAIRPGSWRAWQELPAVIQIPLVITATSYVAWSLGTEKMDLLLMDTVYNIQQPWRLLTSAFMHGDTNHLLLNMLAWIPVALATSVDFLSHGRGRMTRKRTWLVFLLVIVMSSTFEQYFRQMHTPNKRYRALGASDSIIGMYGYSVVSLPSAIKKIWNSFRMENGLIKRVKLFFTSVYGLGVFCLVSYAAFIFYCEDLGAYERALIVPKKSLWGHVLEWAQGEQHRGDGIAHASHLLGFFSGMVVSAISTNIFPYEYVSLIILLTSDRLYVDYCEKSINLVTMFKPV